MQSGWHPKGPQIRCIMHSQREMGFDYLIHNSKWSTLQKVRKSALQKFFILPFFTSHSYLFFWHNGATAHLVPTTWHALSVCEPPYGEPDGGIQRNHHILGPGSSAATSTGTPRSLESFIWKLSDPPRLLSQSLGHLQLRGIQAQQGAVPPSYLSPLGCLCPETYLDMHTTCAYVSAGRPPWDTSRRVRLISNSGAYMSPHDTQSASKEPAYQR